MLAAGLVLVASAGKQAGRAVVGGFVRIQGGAAFGQADAVLGGQPDMALAAVDFGGTGIDTVAGGQGEVALGLDAGADFGSLVHVAVAQIIDPAQGFVVFGLYGTQTDLFAGQQPGLTVGRSVADQGGIGLQPFAGLHLQDAAFRGGYIQPGHPVNSGIAVLSVAAGRGGGAQPDIFGLQLQDVFRSNAAAGEVDVLCGTQTDAAASDLTVVIDVFRTQIHHTAAGYRAVVQHALQTGEADLLGTDQRAGGIHVALSGHYIDFGHQ